MTVRAARMTPPGTGAVATIAVVGKDAWPVIHSLFRSRRRLAADGPPPPGTILYGNFGEPPGDEVLVTVRAQLPWPWFEVHCHGGPQVVGWLLEQIGQREAKIVDWFELESELCGNSLAALALKELPKALTARTAGVLLDQLQGALFRRMVEILQAIGNREYQSAQSQLQALMRLIPVGSRLTTPWRIALCGPPNAGKSSLVNALAGYHRAIVTPIPGTTRDVTATLIAFDGWPMELLDTAGIRHASDSLESAGIHLGLEAAANADLVLWITEPNQPAPPPDALGNVLLVCNKCDLSHPPTHTGMHVSAKTGAGLDELMAVVISNLIGEPPAPQAAVPFTKHLADAIGRAAKFGQADDWPGAAAVLGLLISPADSA